MIIKHNLSSLAAQRYYKINSQHNENNIRKLSSGMRITRASDDPAGLAVSEKMRAQIRGLNQVSRNAQDGISMIQTAGGWLTSTQDILQRMRELAVQSANGIYTNEDRMQISTEIQQLVDEVDRISSQAQFNGMKLLRGGFARPEGAPATPTTGETTPAPTDTATANQLADSPTIAVEKGATNPHQLVRNQGEDTGGVYFHIGPNVDQREKVFIDDMSATALGLAKGPIDEQGNRELFVDYMTQDGSNRAIQIIDSAIFVVNQQRAYLGGYQSRLEKVILGTDIAAENLQSAESQIRDLDMSAEMVNFVKNQILSQASASMLAQANLRPQVVLRILG